MSCRSHQQAAAACAGALQSHHELPLRSHGATGGDHIRAGSDTPEPHPVRLSGTAGPSVPYSRGCGGEGAQSEEGFTDGRQRDTYSCSDNMQSMQQRSPTQPAARSLGGGWSPPIALGRPGSALLLAFPRHGGPSPLAEEGRGFRPAPLLLPPPPGVSARGWPMRTSMSEVARSALSASIGIDGSPKAGAILCHVAAVSSSSQTKMPRSRRARRHQWRGGQRRKLTA